MTELIDKEFSPVLAMVLERGPSGMEKFRSGTHANVAPEVVEHCKVLISEARKCAEKLSANKKQLEIQEKNLVTELNEQRTIILGEMEREVNDAKNKMKAIKEKKQAELEAAQNADDGEPPSPARSIGTSGSSSTALSISQQKSPAASLIATLNKKGDDSSAPPGDVDYWRAQAQDLCLVVQGRRETDLFKLEFVASLISTNTKNVLAASLVYFVKRNTINAKRQQNIFAKLIKSKSKLD
jgi:hypothetical protein